MPEESMVCTAEALEESSKSVPFVPSVKESIAEIGPEKEVHFSSFAPSPEKDQETIHSTDSRGVSSSETGSGILTETGMSTTEAATMAEACSENVFVPEMGSEEVLEKENFVDEERKTKETDGPIGSLSEPSSGFSEKGENVDDNTVFIVGVHAASFEIQVLGGYNREEESLNLEDKGKEKEVERLLEAEKKRLLDEIEVGTIFGENTNADTLTNDSDFFIDGNACQQQQETVENLILKDHAFAGRSLKVEVIDGTAVVDVVPICKKGKDNSEILETSHPDTNNIVKVNVGSKQGKGTRRKTKENGNASKMDRNLVVVSEFPDLGENNGNPWKIRYTRKQMEAMRFSKIVDQRRLWSDIYTGLAPEVVTEYEGLATLKNQKNSKSNRDRARAIPKIGDIGILEHNELEEITGEDHVMEEYYTEDDDSDDDYNSILKPAFVVEGEPDFDSGPPEDGFEYLRRVRWEARQIPKVKVAKRDTSKHPAQEQTVYMPQLPEIAQCPEHLLPLKEWEDVFLSNFSDLRLALSELDMSNGSSIGYSGSVLNPEEEITSCQRAEDLTNNVIMEMFNSLNSVEMEATSEYPFDEPLTKVSSKEEILLFERNPKSRPITCSSLGEYPKLSAIQGMDSVTRVSMLKKRISLVEAANSLQKNDCVWLFALCAAVDTPLDADTCACLRGLLRKFANVRAAKSEMDDEVIMGNILATISGRYFSQMEPCK